MSDPTSDPRTSPAPPGGEGAPSLPGVGPAALEALEALLAPGAEELEVGGNEPIPLKGAWVWMVRSGKVEVFTQEPGEGDSAGPRRHVGTAAPGQLLFGVGSGGGDPELKLIAVGLRETRLLRLPTSRLQQLARDPATVPPLATAVETWISFLVRGLPLGAPPKVFEELRTGTEVHLPEPGQAGRPGRGVAWLRHVEGRSYLLGVEELPLEPAPYLVPVPEEGWVTGTGATRISCVATSVLLRGGLVWEGLDRFHGLFLRHAALLQRRAAARERERLDRRLDLDRRTVEAAHNRLASVLGVSPRSEVGFEELAAPLLSACRLVGEAQGIPLRPPPEHGAEATRHLLDRICAASRVRHRRVILRDGWWRRDNGPLLGFHLPETEGSGDSHREREHRPVALLPISPRSYEMVDPADGSRTPVDGAVADGLAGEAYMLYPVLPERPLGFRDLLHLALKDRRRDLGTILLMGVAGGLLGLLVPIITGQIFGRAVPGADRVGLLQMTAALTVGAFAAAIFQVTRSIAVLRLGGKIDGTLQAAVWDRLLRLPVNFFRRYTTGDLANRSMGVDTIRELLTGNVITSALAAIFSLFSFALLFYYSARLALIATLVVVLLLSLTAGLVVLQLRHQRRLFHLQGKIASLLFGLIGGLAKLRIAGAEPRAYALWAERFSQQRRHTIEAQRIANLQTVVNSVYAVLTAMALFAMVGLSSQIDLEVSEFLAFNAAFGQFQAATLSVVGMLSSVLTLVPIYERLSPILEEAPEVDPAKLEAGELAGDVEMSHLSFRYQKDGPLILEDVSLRARPGELVALVGPSGSGKSTCLRLLLAFEQPGSGSIYYDGQDLASLDIQSVRRQIGVVLQSSQPMAGDLFSNIVGSSNLTMDDAWEAAEMVGLADDIRAMPMGMHTIISEGAGTFSGGQKQRLLIARAIVHRPRILFFDEATSALDNRTQEIVTHSLERLKATRIVVAHRLSTIAGADRIFVLERGRVVEEGSYDDLVRREGLFARLVERQVA